MLKQHLFTHDSNHPNRNNKN